MKTLARRPVALALLAALVAATAAPVWADPDAARHGLSKYEKRERDADSPADRQDRREAERERERAKVERALPPPPPQAAPQVQSAPHAPRAPVTERSAGERTMRPGATFDAPPAPPVPRATNNERSRGEPTRPGFTNDSGFITTPQVPPVPNGRREADVRRNDPSPRRDDAAHHDARRWDGDRRPDNNGWQNNAPRPAPNTWSVDNRRNDDRRRNDNDWRRDDHRWNDNDRRRDDHRWNDNDRRPQLRPRNHVDIRINVDRRYPTYGHVVHTLPRGYRQVPHRQGDYWFHGGVWYRPWGSSWVVVRPPLGVSISVLPPFYSTLWFAGVPYYYANGLYYQWRPYERQYAVVDPPQDIDTSGDIDWYEELYVYPTAGQSEQQEANDRYECHRWAVDQTRFDPTQPPEHMTRRQYADAWEDYRRAVSACLEARNYSVE